jgi:hydroxyethylthiazole kinase-like uncharacterized protein yjeF
MRIVDTKEMKQIKQIAKEEFFYDEGLIIENVGIQGSSIIQSKIIDTVPNSELVFLIGKGNNGADGLAIARHLTTLGNRVRAFMFFPHSECSEELKKQAKMAEAFGVNLTHIEQPDQLEGYFNQLSSSVIVVDALFGTGVQLPLSNFLYDVIKFVNDNSSYIVSIDMPSGVEGDTGFIKGNAIDANLTLAVALPKLGYYVAEGARLVGDIEVLDIGFPRDLTIEDLQIKKYLDIHL